MQYGEDAGATDKGYYIYSLVHLARIAEKEGNKASAKNYYTKVKKVTNRKHAANEEAREHLKKL